MNDNKEKILKRFPKTRPPLPKAIEEVYEEYLQMNRKGESAATGLASRMERWLHKKVAEDLKNGKPSNDTLEIGAGTLNQLPYEESVKNYDVVEPFDALINDSPHLNRVRTRYRDINDVPTELRYDRITSVAAFEHICELPELVAKTTLFLKEDGSLRVSIPSEGSILWYLGWRLTTGVDFYFKYKQNYSKLMRFEHVNNYREIKEVLSYFYKDISTSSFGPTPSLSFYQFFECRNPNKELGTSFLKGN